MPTPSAARIRIPTCRRRSDTAPAKAVCPDRRGAPGAVILAKELTAVVRIPMIAVLGNHDFESGQQEEVCRILTDAGVKVLDGEACEIGGVGIAGAKGFAGGFGRGTLGAWGEQATKRFVQEAIDEALKLERALARLRTRQRVARAGSRSRSTATRWMWSSMGMRITGRPKGGPARGRRYTTSRCPSCCRNIRTGRRSGWWSCRRHPLRKPKPR